MSKIRKIVQYFEKACTCLIYPFYYNNYRVPNIA